MAQAAPIPPRLTFAMELRVEVGTPVEVGNVAGGRRRIISILGGTFAGPDVRGAVLSGGADWQIVRGDGFTELDTRYTLRTDRDELIYIRNAGIRHAAPRFRTRERCGSTRASDPRARPPAASA